MIGVVQDLRHLFGLVRDQGSRPTCLAFATSDAHAALRKAWTPLSCEFAFYHAQRRAGRPPSVGASLPHMLDALRNDGQPAEADWPYLRQTPSEADGYGPPASVIVFRRAGEARPTKFEEVMGLIDRDRPALILMMLSDAFYFPDAEGVVRAPAYELPDPMRRHAVVAVAHGLVGSQRAVLVRNSWGDGWGLAGHAWLLEDYLVPRLTRVAHLTENLDVPGSNLAA